MVINKLTRNTKIRPLIDNGETLLVQLTRGKFATIDKCDYNVACQWNWLAFPVAGDKGVFYAKRNMTVGKKPNGGTKQRMIGLHNAILGVSSDAGVDHIDRNPLNCTRSNLRLATTKENSRNRGNRSDNISGYKGVGYRGDNDCWRARIVSDTGRRISIGSFSSPEEAATAYDEYALKIFGEFAVLNFP